MAARRRLRQPCQLSPGIAPPSSWGFSRAVRRVVLGTTDPEGWVADSGRGRGWWGCPLALLQPVDAQGPRPPQPSLPRDEAAYSRNRGGSRRENAPQGSRSEKEEEGPISAVFPVE